MTSSALSDMENVHNKTDYVALKEVYITKDAFMDMENHADEGKPNEIGGFLLGKPIVINNGHSPCCKNDDLIIWVLKTVCGDCISQRAHVTIESSTYNRAWHEIERSDNNLVIVGWYHTHPGMGIFLSQTDVNNMELYYHKPYQIAIVIDPIQNERGVFGWRDGHVNSTTKVKSYIFEGEDYKKYFHEKCDDNYWRL